MATTFIRGSNPIWWIPDLVGQSLNDEYYISFLSNTFPYLPSLVYHDNQGATPWSQPVQFLANGTLPTDIYFADNQVYRLEIRHGATQSDALIYTINDYDPAGNGGIAPSTITESTLDNQISNPQFAFINFVSPLSITAAGTYSVAPDWDLILTGAGACTVTQLIFSGNQGSAISPVPPYALRINTNGFTTAILQQRLNNNGGIWADKFISGTILARSEDGVARALTLIYAPSTGTQISINDVTTLSVGAYTVLGGAKAIGVSTNATLNTTAYVNINIQLPGTGIVDLSDVQIMGQNTLIALTSVVPEPQPDETIERQIDHLFHYYKDPLIYKPIPSYTLGWDFGVNPCQELGTTVVVSGLGNNKSRYVADQTIVFEAVGNAISYGFNALQGMVVSTTTATQFAIIQYLDASTARELLQAGGLAVKVSAATTGTALNGYVNMYFTTDVTLPVITTAGTNLSLVATMVSGQPATFNGTWTKVLRPNLGDAILPVPANATYTDFSFSGWDGLGQTGATTATYFAIVISFAQMPSTQSLGLRFATLARGSIATTPPPMNPQEVLNGLQYYYEKSYDPGVTPGSVSSLSALHSEQLGAVVAGDILNIPRTFSFRFNTEKRSAISTVTIFSPVSGTGNLVREYLRNGGAAVAGNADVAIGGWTVTNLGAKGITYVANNVTSMQTTAAAQNYMEGYITYHYSCDARFGVV